MRNRVLAAFLRLAIGVILVATAVGKMLDIGGFARILGNYRVLPSRWLGPLAVVVVAVEVVLGLWLLSGRRLAAAALAAAALHVVYASWSATAVERGLKLSNCGCFGVFWARPLGWSTVVEDLLLAAASVGLFLLVPRRT